MTTGSTFETRAHTGPDAGTDAGRAVGAVPTSERPRRPTAMTSLPDPLRRAELAPHLAELHGAFSSAEPFPHIVVDDFVAPEVAARIADEFPIADGAAWQRFATTRELKLALRDTEQMGPLTRAVIAELNGQTFIEFLEAVTGITGIVPDPHLVGGGLHQIGRGGHLGVHADFNRHEHLRLDRRLNLLLYLNRDWSDDYGGHLELWDRDMVACRHRIAPIAGRMVLFATTDDALHGHPDPLVCPPARARRSIALYYYSNGRPDAEVTASHTTLFHARPGTSRRRRLAAWTADRALPPLLTDAVRRRGHRSASDR